MSALDLDVSVTQHCDLIGTSEFLLITTKFWISQRRQRTATKTCKVIISQLKTFKWKMLNLRTSLYCLFFLFIPQTQRNCSYRTHLSLLALAKGFFLSARCLEWGRPASEAQAGSVGPSSPACLVVHSGRLRIRWLGSGNTSSTIGV